MAQRLHRGRSLRQKHIDHRVLAYITADNSSAPRIIAA
jgi:hypothetical protein